MAMQWRRLGFFHGDVPHGDALVIDELPGACTRKRVGRFLERFWEYRNQQGKKCGFHAGDSTSVARQRMRKIRLTEKQRRQFEVTMK